MNTGLTLRDLRHGRQAAVPLAAPYRVVASAPVEGARHRTNNARHLNR